MAVVVLIPLVFVACSSSSNAATPLASVQTTTPVPGEPPGVKTYSGVAHDHVDTPVTYPQSPPVGGNHSSAWQNCQYYDTSVPNERAVHSLEHGAVWITYLPNASQADRAVLRALAATGDHILVSEYPGQLAPIVATAWGKQLYLQTVNDPELQQFVDFFQGGSQAPEPGVTCRDSTDATT